MYSFKDKWVNVNYVLNVRSPCITKNTLNSCSMLHAGISGVAMRKCILGREWNIQVRINKFSFTARCFRMYLMQIREVIRNGIRQYCYKSTFLILKQYLTSVLMNGWIIYKVHQTIGICQHVLRCYLKIWWNVKWDLVPRNIYTIPSLAAVLSIKPALRSSVHSGTLVRADTLVPGKTDITDTLVAAWNFKPELRRHTESLLLGIPRQCFP